MSEASSSRKRSSDILDEATSAKRSKNDQLREETQLVLEILKLEDKGTNFIKVQKRLNDNFGNENRLQLVIEEFLTEQKLDTVIGKDEDKIDELFFRDLSTLINVLKTVKPDSPVDENQVYEALLKCPNIEQRINLTLQELLNKDGGDAPTLTSCSDQQLEASAIVKEPDDHLDAGDVSSDEDEDNDNIEVLTDAGLAERNRLENMSELIVAAFPDVERGWLWERLEKNIVNPACLQIVSDNMMEKGYPKAEAKAGPTREDLLSLEFEDEEFLKTYPDPFGFFHRTDAANPRVQPSESYVRNALYELGLEFPQRRSKTIEGIFRKSMSYSSARKSLMESVRKRKGAKEVKTRNCIPPKTWDERLYKEFWFSRNEDRLKNLLEERKAMRELKMEEARKNGMLVTCPICFDDEVLPDEVLPCKGGHEFCPECVRRSAEVVIGEGRTRFPCLCSEESCKEEFSSSVLLAILPRSIYHRVLDKKLEEEFKDLGEAHPDLVQCPFCIYLVSMPDPNDKVLRCMNPDCLKETCRYCKELNHVPLSCDEVEKSSEMDFRKKVEMEMTEAMIRTCPKCKKRFYKIEGCNKMTCTCGTTMCYICRTPNIDYNHFDNKKCVLHTDNNKTHELEVGEAAKRAKEEYLRNEPNANLKYDPTSTGSQKVKKGK